MHHRHTQIGYLMIFVFGVGVLFALGRPWSHLAIVILAAGLALFPTLTIEIVDKALVWYFGLGLIRKKLPLADIDKVTVVKNRLLQGWGIRRLREGWLYNVSGFDAVELTLNDGRIIRLGTDRAEELARVISAAKGKESISPER